MPNILIMDLQFRYDLVEHESSIFVNNFRLCGLCSLFLVSLDSCVNQDPHKSLFVWLLRLGPGVVQLFPRE